MKKLLLITIIAIAFTSCKKWNGGSTINVNVRFAYYSGSNINPDSTGIAKGADVALLENGIPYLTETTDAEGNCKFIGLKKDKYSATAQIMLSGKVCDITSNDIYVLGTHNDVQEVDLIIVHK